MTTARVHACYYNTRATSEQHLTTPYNTRAMTDISIPWSTPSLINAAIMVYSKLVYGLAVLYRVNALASAAMRPSHCTRSPPYDFEHTDPDRPQTGGH